MRVLLDTHAFLWWVAEDDRLPGRARRVIADQRNEALFSVVSAWEIVVSAGLGRLRLDVDPPRFIERELGSNAFTVLPLFLHHGLAVADLPEHHRDPFDRLLVAQALSERVSLVSGDRALRPYPVKIVWD